MADEVQFQEEQYKPRLDAEQKSFFIRLVLSTGIVSDDQDAEKVLLGVAVAAVVIAIAIPLFLGGSSSGDHVSPAEVRQVMNGGPVLQ